MVATLNGIAFDQVYGDNSGGAEFDTDGDGTATQEDEFVSFTNTTGAPVDVSGWQVWSDSTGAGAPDSVQDGLYHTFPPGTVIGPGQTLYVINEISAPGVAFNAQQASEGGQESPAGGDSTNFLSEGEAGVADEAIYLVNPATGDYLTFNMSPDPPDPSNMSGFPGTNEVGVIDGNAVQEDQNAGSSYQYDAATGTYQYGAVYVPCFAAGTLIQTDRGARAVETLRPGDGIVTLDGQVLPLIGMLDQVMNFAEPAQEPHKPILFAPGALGPGRPNQPLSVSPQHRMLIRDADGVEVLVPAKALLNRPGVRKRRGMRMVRYFHLLLERHEVIIANGAPAESFLPGPYSMTHLKEPSRRLIERSALSDARACRPVLTVGQARARLH